MATRGVGDLDHGLTGDGNTVGAIAVTGTNVGAAGGTLVVAGAAAAVAVHAGDDGAGALVAVEGVGLKIAVAVAAVHRVGQLVLRAVLVLVRTTLARHGRQLHRLLVVSRLVAEAVRVGAGAQRRAGQEAAEEEGKGRAYGGKTCWCRKLVDWNIKRS